jgi:SAM-dependent methyltransferase
MSGQDSAQRFTGRVQDYLRYRPGYPREVLLLLHGTCGLLPSHVVADIGSGTGKLAELFLSNGNTVFCVEPNPEMREAAERLLAEVKGFRSVSGTAEATRLPDASVDFVTAGQAFHWFDAKRAREEFRRILRPAGYVVLLWNQRVDTASPFLAGYEEFLREYSVDYGMVQHRRLLEADAIRGFFRADAATAFFDNPRSLDFDALWGGYLSASYTLTPAHPRYGEARERLRALFDAHARHGAVAMPLVTEVHRGRL